LVSKGSNVALIRIDQIQCISAAGNYVEIFCNNQLYLMRATMKQIEDLLPREQFLRTHRSHIININEIDRIKSQPSGNGAVQLRCGKMLSISKKYKNQLQKFRAQAA
jgi:DNA-binding LytR/AlgR family response regulator